MTVLVMTSVTTKRLLNTGVLITPATMSAETKNEDRILMMILALEPFLSGITDHRYRGGRDERIQKPSDFLLNARKAQLLSFPRPGCGGKTVNVANGLRTKDDVSIGKLKWPFDLRNV